MFTRDKCHPCHCIAFYAVLIRVNKFQYKNKQVLVNLLLLLKLDNVSDIHLFLLWLKKDELMLKYFRFPKLHFKYKPD